MVEYYAGRDMLRVPDSASAKRWQHNLGIKRIMDRRRGFPALQLADNSMNLGGNSGWPAKALAFFALPSVPRLDHTNYCQI
jgi:hypothetical protein